MFSASSRRLARSVSLHSVQYTQTRAVASVQNGLRGNASGAHLPRFQGLLRWRQYSQTGARNGKVPGSRGSTRPPPRVARQKRLSRLNEDKAGPGKAREEKRRNNRRAVGEGEELGIADGARKKGIPKMPIFLGVSGCIGALWYSSLDEEGNVTGVFRTISDHADNMVDYVMGSQEEPVRKQLLPEFPKFLRGPDGSQPPTLVLGLEDTLVHIVWDQKNGFRVAKRPGVDKFIQYLSQFYEIVVFSALPFSTADEIITALDPHQLIAHRLFQDSTCKEGREFKKDISYLNRDLTQTVCVEGVREALSRQPENAAFIKRFEDPTVPDTELEDLLPFLIHLARRPGVDYRHVLKNEYGNVDVGKKFNEKLKARQQLIREKRRFGGSMWGGGGGR